MKRKFHLFALLFIMAGLLLAAGCGEADQAPAVERELAVRTMMRPAVPSDSNGIFVSASRGSDSNPGTIASPVQTISRGTHKALKVAKSVFVEGGGANYYFESVWVKTNIYCGYNSDYSTYDPYTYPTMIDPTGNDKNFTMYIGDMHDATPVEIHGCLLQGPMAPAPLARVLVVRGQLDLQDCQVMGGFAENKSIAIVVKAGGVLTATNNFIFLGDAMIGNAIGVQNQNGVITLIGNNIDIMGAGGGAHSIGVHAWAAGTFNQVSGNTISMRWSGGPAWNVAVDGPTPLVLDTNVLEISMQGLPEDALLFTPLGGFYTDIANVNNCGIADPNCFLSSGNTVP